MASFKRKIKRSVAKAQGLPPGFYCNVMQRKMRALNNRVQHLNKLIDEERDNLAAPSEEKVPNGEESNT